jgi:hypothetical protein
VDSAESDRKKEEFYIYDDVSGREVFFNTHLLSLFFVDPICAIALCVGAVIVHLCDNYLVVTVNAVNGTLVVAVYDRVMDGNVVVRVQEENQLVKNRNEVMHRLP